MKNKDLRAWLSDLFILFGLALLMGAGLFWAKNALAAQQVEEQTYLVSKVDHDLPLPTLTPTPLPTIPPPTPTPEPTAWIDESVASSSQPAEPLPATAATNPDSQSNPTPTAEMPTQVLTDTPPLITQEVLTDTLEVAPPIPVPSAGRIVRLVIPRLGIDRTTIPIGLVRNGGRLDWNTDKLFANRNRPDLVGHLTTSVNPGDGGNIVLVGHNYNNGYNWNGVFVNLKSLKPGDRISVQTENGGEFHYIVQTVKQVPWVQKKGSELEKHLSYLWPKPHEQLTLVTCGGANLWTWSARVYVVALPAGN